METIFENQFTHTKEYYSEYYKYIQLKSPLMLIINTILGIGFIIAILSMIFPKFIVMDIANITGNILTVLIILCIELYIFYRNKDMAYNRDLERNKGNPIEIKLLITENTINISSIIEESIEIANIEKVIKTKNYYILISKAKLSIALKKDGFTKGTAEQFEEFLKRKKL